MFKKVLVANRGEIAIRVLRAATELGIPTVAIHSREDRFALHRFKADESYQIGAGKGPIEAYLDVDAIIAVAKRTGADAIHPGYGFLSENPAFAEACRDAGITFIGPSSDTMRLLGNKVAARNLAVSADVPVMPATGALPDDMTETARLAEEIGYPLMLKASWGGGGRGMRVIETAKDLPDMVAAAKREAQAAFGNGEVYLEKLVRRARHVEVQVLGDAHGNLVHLFERDCSVQRRNQKVVERAPAVYLTSEERRGLCDAALKLATAAGYCNAGTVEFLMDADTGAFYFIEVNPRIQVEHTITEVVTGIDIVKAQIRIAAGAAIGTEGSGVPAQDDIRLSGHAIQCRVTTEDPDNNFIPDYGRITAYRDANGFGIRLDGGTAFSGALITRHYDSLLEKVIAWAPTPDEAIARMDRALREFRIRGVATNLAFLEALIAHPQFRTATYTTRFIDTTPELFQREKRRDRATRLLTFLADVMVNGNPELKGAAIPRPADPKLPVLMTAAPPPGLKQRLDLDGPEAVAKWLRAQSKVLVTDTSFRDAHQSLLATRMRTHDLVAPAAAGLLVRTLRQEVGLLIHFHTHDTSGAGAASVLAAVEAGVDAVDAAMDSLSGQTSQPPLGPIVAALKHTPRDTGLDSKAVTMLSQYWEQVRRCYAPFESDVRAGSSDVYRHEMPGGQYTNLREQARSLGIEEHWDRVVEAYAAVNRMFGDIVKVTPTSKMVGDMALMMVTSGLSEAEVLDPAREIAFPESVVQFMRGELGQPPGGFPEVLRKKVLKGETPLACCPGAAMPAVDLEACRAEAEAQVGRPVDDRQLASYLMYPKVFTDFAGHRQAYCDVGVLPTPVFFHGLSQGEEVSLRLEPGKVLIVRYLATGEPDESGQRAVFFELNGQPRTIKVTDRTVAPRRAASPKAEAGNAAHVGAPMPGLVTALLVRPGQAVEVGDALVSLEAMKMETTVRAERTGTVERIVAEQGRNVETKDLLVVFAG
jgi:acetyl-CoA carboxylase biotin carboxylase subunit